VEIYGSSVGSWGCWDLMGFLSNAGLGCILEGHINNKVAFIKVFLLNPLRGLPAASLLLGLMKAGLSSRKLERSHIPIKQLRSYLCILRFHLQPSLQP